MDPRLSLLEALPGKTITRETIVKRDNIYIYISITYLISANSTMIASPACTA